MGTSRLWVVALFLLVFSSVNCALAEPVIERVRARGEALAARVGAGEDTPTATRPRPTPRPTFTPTPNYTATPTITPTPSITPIPSDTPTPPPTNTSAPTNTPVPTDTPEPTNTRPPPPPPPPTEIPTPAPTPTPDYPYVLAEQGNREFQKTNYHAVLVLAAVTDQNNTPIGGLKFVGNHSSGKYAESPLTDWRYTATNCLGCDYIKQGNVKFEPGPFEDGTWTIYLADNNGTRLSQDIALSYSANPDTWVWDFLILKKK